MSIPDIPVDPTDSDSLTFYIARGASSTYTAMPAESNSEAPPIGVETMTFDQLPTGGWTPPATTTGYGTATASVIQSYGTAGTEKTWWLDGSGAGRVGPWKWDKDGNDLTDSGWIAPTLTSNFVAYGSDVAAEYRKIGKVVFIQGAVKPATSAVGTGMSNGGGPYTLFTLPSGYRPPTGHADPVFVCQGSGTNKWAMRVNASDGTVDITRYDGTAGTGTWLPFCISYLLP